MTGLKPCGADATGADTDATHAGTDATLAGTHVTQVGADATLEKSRYGKKGILWNGGFNFQVQL